MRIHHLLIGIMSVTLAMNCGLSTLDETGSTPPATGKACTTDANCDDYNPCTADLCANDTKVCEYAAQPEGPAAFQLAADCKTIVCNAANPVDQEDAQDVFNDDEDCTDDVCSGGTPMNTPKADGIACMVGQTPGTCVGGVCTP